MATESKYLVRIRPSSGRSTQVVEGRTFTKAGGWYNCPEDLAKRLRDHAENDLNPESSERVFEVAEREQAKDIDLREKRLADPAGTPDNPRSIADYAAVRRQVVQQQGPGQPQQPGPHPPYPQQPPQPGEQPPANPGQPPQPGRPGYRGDRKEPENLPGQPEQQGQPHLVGQPGAPGRPAQPLGQEAEKEPLDPTKRTEQGHEGSKRRDR
jgi:hypothetical protein